MCERGGACWEAQRERWYLCFYLNHKAAFLSSMGAVGRGTVAKEEMKVKSPWEAGAGQHHFSRLMNCDL